MNANYVCDFRAGCANMKKAFGARATLTVTEAIRSSPHLAEALVIAGLVSRPDAVNMALALQDARQCPMPDCDCTGGSNGKREAPTTAGTNTGMNALLQTILQGTTAA